MRTNLAHGRLSIWAGEWAPKGKEHIVKHILSILVLGMICGGCIAVGDGGSNTKVTNPTVGKQLSDLKDAHDKGAISDEEYASTKAKFLNDVH
jgi:hypothetical protein